MIETPVTDEAGLSPDSRSGAGGPPRFFALFESTAGSLFAGTCGRGVSCSTDGGRTWAPSRTGTEADGGTVNAFAAAADGSLLAAAGSAGALRSNDDGATWHGIGPDDAAVYAICACGDGLAAGVDDGLRVRSGDGVWSTPVDGPHSSVYRLLALSDGRVMAATDSAGIWVMDDRGHWAPIGTSDWPVYALADLGGGIMLAGTRGGGVLRTVDGGRSWSPSNDGLPDPVVHVLVDAGSGVVLAGTGRGVARSVDGGSRWMPLGTGLADHRIFSLTITRDDAVLAGSYDGVWSWRATDPAWVGVDTGLGVGESFAVGVADSGEALVGSQGEVYRSSDRGTTWERWSGPIDAGNAYGFCFADSGDVLVGTDDGVWRLSPGVGHWVHDGLAGMRVYRLLEALPDLVLAGTLGHGVQRREPHGIWQPANLGLGHPMVFDVMRASHSGHVFAGSGDLANGAKTGGIFRSSDQGCSWEPMDVEPITVYRIVEASDGVMVAGAQRSCILRSWDHGATWQASRPRGCEDAKLYCLFADGSDRLYLGSGARLLCSDDRGDSWHVIGAGLDGVTVYGMAVHPSGVLLGATSSGAYRSDDRGHTWQASPWPQRDD